MIDFILSKQRIFKQIIVLFSDIFILLFALWISYYIQSRSILYPDDAQYIIYLVSFGTAIPIFYYFRLYDEIFRYAGFYTFINILKANIFYLLIFNFIIYILKSELIISSSISIGIPLSVAIFHPFLVFLLMFLSRFFAKEVIINYTVRKKNIYTKDVIIYGSSMYAYQLTGLQSFKRKYNVVAFIGEKTDLKRKKINSINIYSLEYITTLIKQYSIKEVIIADESLTQENKNALINKLKKFKINILSFDEKITSINSAEELNNSIELNVNDLLGRKEVRRDLATLKENLKDQVVLITGAGGTIGFEISKNIIELDIKELIILDANEFSLYNTERELIEIINRLDKKIKLKTILADLKSLVSIQKVFDSNFIDIIYHAAAYKHVPLVEKNITEGINNNIFGTLNICKIAYEKNIKKFTLVSTDKAVRPTNVMGATKRVSELIVQAYADSVINSKKISIFSIVRFGNVLDSTGSVIPLFREQIKNGGPITLTHKNITRFFMTISEASYLVIMSGIMAKGGEIFLLDMGKSVKIYDLAKRMVELSGLTIKSSKIPKGDIEIVEVGLRPGEKLFEELLIEKNSKSTSNKKIYIGQEKFIKLNDLQVNLDELYEQLYTINEISLKKLIVKIVSEYSPQI